MYSSMLCSSLDGKGVCEKMIHIYVWLSPFTIHLKLSQHCYSAILQYKIKSFFLKKKKKAKCRTWSNNQPLVKQEVIGLYVHFQNSIGKLYRT